MHLIVAKNLSPLLPWLGSFAFACVLLAEFLVCSPCLSNPHKAEMLSAAGRTKKGHP